MAFQLTAMGSCHSPQARVGSEMRLANGQKGFADGRGMVRLRKICCKRGSQSRVFFLLSVSFWPFLTQVSWRVFLSPTPVFLLYPFTVFRLLTQSRPSVPGRPGRLLPHSRQRAAHRRQCQSCLLFSRFGFSFCLPSSSHQPRLLPVS